MNVKILANINQGFRVEHVGEEIVVLDGGGLVVHTLTGDVARCFDLIANGQTETEVSPALETLVAAGLVTITDGTDETAVSRRKALTYGAVGAGVVAVGFSTMALPSAVAAASAGGGGGGGGATTTTTPSGTPTSQAVFGTSRNNTAPFVYRATAEWFDDGTGDPHDFAWEITVVSSTSPVLNTGDVLYSGSGVDGLVRQVISQWVTVADLVIKIEVTSTIGGVVQFDTKSRP